VNKNAGVLVVVFFFGGTKCRSKKGIKPKIKCELIGYVLMAAKTIYGCFRLEPDQVLLVIVGARYRGIF